MQTIATKMHDEELVWKPVHGVQAVVFVATSEGRPLAIIELRPGHGFHVTMCSGADLGQFDSLAAGQAAVAERVDARALASSDSL